MVNILKISDFMACGSFLLFMFRVCHAVVYCVFDTFPCGVLGQMWYLIVSIPHLCLLPYSATKLSLKCFDVDGSYFVY